MCFKTRQASTRDYMVMRICSRTYCLPCFNPKVWNQKGLMYFAESFEDQEREGREGGRRSISGIVLLNLLVFKSSWFSGLRDDCFLDGISFLTPAEHDFRGGIKSDIFQVIQKLHKKMSLVKKNCSFLTFLLINFLVWTLCNVQNL